MESAVVKRVASIQGISPRVLVATVVAAIAGVGFGIVQGWPIWAYALVVVIATAPVLALETAWLQDHHGWLALFYILVVTQLGHVGEHVSQVFQIHVLGRQGPDARGVFGQLDIEWVHFVWNTWVLVAVLLLLTRFRHNPWLLVAAVFAAWHEAEHIAIMTTFWDTGKAGTPGLLAEGGRIGGGVGLARPDLHFFYNIVETTPLIAAFIWQVRRTYDAWLARAFPTLPAPLLLEATGHATVERFGQGKTVIDEGSEGDRIYVISKGEADVVRGAPLREVHLASLGPGQFFGEVAVVRGIPRTATVRARTALQVLALDKASFISLIERSDSTGDDVRRLIAERLTPA